VKPEIPVLGPVHTPDEFIISTPPTKVLNPLIDAPDAVICEPPISKPADTVDDDNDKAPVDLTLNCNFTLSLSNTICGSEFPVVPVGYIITLGIIIIDFQFR
jgi:hypothetical protein